MQRLRAVPFAILCRTCQERAEEIGLRARLALSPRSLVLRRPVILDSWHWRNHDDEWIQANC